MPSESCPLHLARVTILAVLTALLLVACGGSQSPSGSGSGGASRSALAASNFDKFPECMRTHGVSNFPDPHVTGHSASIRITPAVTGSPAFKSAQQACAYLLPASAGRTNGTSAAQQKARTAGLLAFAACVRTHGFPSFPDPTSQGQLTLEMITRAGINLRQPAVLRAGDACVSVSQGQITRGDVAQAVANPNASGSQSSQASP